MEAYEQNPGKVLNSILPSSHINNAIKPKGPKDVTLASVGRNRYSSYRPKDSTSNLFRFFSSSDDVRMSAERRYSGLFEYHIPTNTWKKRRDDSAAAAAAAATANSAQANQPAQNPTYANVTANGETGQNELRSRSSHSMLFHPVISQL